MECVWLSNKRTSLKNRGSDPSLQKNILWASFRNHLWPHWESGHFPYILTLPHPLQCHFSEPPGLAVFLTTSPPPEHRHTGTSGGAGAPGPGGGPRHLLHITLRQHLLQKRIHVELDER